MFTASAPTTSPLPSRPARKARPLAPAPAPLPAAPTMPAECLTSAQDVRAGEAVQVTTSVVDAAGRTMYRIVDRFIRTDDDAFRWIPNVGAARKPSVSLVATRVWSA